MVGEGGNYETARRLELGVIVRNVLHDLGAALIGDFGGPLRLRDRDDVFRCVGQNGRRHRQQRTCEQCQQDSRFFHLSRPPMVPKRADYVPDQRPVSCRGGISRTVCPVAERV